MIITRLKSIYPKFINAFLKKYYSIFPNITLRMDIINKCNLECIMCHFSDPEFRKKPVEKISPDQIKHLLNNIAPFLKRIVLSCGYEPLMNNEFPEVINTISHEFPHIRIEFVTNGTLLNESIRHSLIQNQINKVIFSIDGVTAKTVERIRKGATFESIIGNIKALNLLKKESQSDYPLLEADFVMMNSNIHEGLSFPKMCKEMGIEFIDFRHAVPSVYFQANNEMLDRHKAKYNYYRQRIIQNARDLNIKIGIPESMATEENWIPDDKDIPMVDLSDFNRVQPDNNSSDVPQIMKTRKTVSINPFILFPYIYCKQPFREILIAEMKDIKPCPYYNEIITSLDEKTNLYDIFFGGKFRDLRTKMLKGEIDEHCRSCPNAKYFSKKTR